MTERPLLRNFVLPTLLLSLALACSGAEPPEGPAHTYELTALDGQPVPHLLTATVSCDEILLRGTLILTAGRTHGLVLEGTIDCTRVGGGLTPTSRRFSGQYEINDGSITFREMGSAGSNIDWSGNLRGGTLRAVLPPLTSLALAPISATFRAT